MVDLLVLGTLDRDDPSTYPGRLAVPGIFLLLFMALWRLYQRTKILPPKYDAIIPRSGTFGTCKINYEEQGQEIPSKKL
jgi:hypothetical protein